MYLKWYEGRLTFLNLQDLKADELSKKELESLWIPQIILYNTKTKKSTLVDQNAIVDVQRVGTLKEQKNTRVFDGLEKPIIMKRFYFTIFVCNFNMAWYPFDTQTCKIEFAIDFRLLDVLDIVVRGFRYSGPQVLTEYFLK